MEELTIMSLPDITRERILWYLSNHRDKMCFATVLETGDRTDAIMHNIFQRQKQNTINWMVSKGESIGWAYKRKFDPLIKAKRIAKKWRNPGYCQECGKFSTSSYNVNCVLIRTGKRLCARCVYRECKEFWCKCGLQAVCLSQFAAYFDRSYDSMVRKETALETVIPTEWYAICPKRRKFLEDSGFEGKFVVKRGLETPDEEPDPRTGCNYEERGTTNCLEYIRMVKKQQWKTLRRSPRIKERNKEIKKEQRRKRKKRIKRTRNKIRTKIRNNK